MTFAYLLFPIAMNSKAPTTTPLPSEPSDSESLYIRLAKSHAATAYALVNKRYVGDAKPIFVDHHRG